MSTTAFLRPAPLPFKPFIAPVAVGATRQLVVVRPKNVPCMSISRRTLLRRLISVPIALPLLLQSSPVFAAMYSTDTAPSFTITGDPKKVATYLPRIEAGYKTLLSLRDNWKDKTAAYDGDVVRRDLGTVGVKSPLFNIRKVFLNAWQIIAESSQDDEYIERLESEWNDVLNGISSVDFQLYSVGFTELTETKDSLVTQGRLALDDLISTYASMLEDFQASL